ncbi:MAG TPA: 3'(2'),5'-bisphosphate nucleotidase CysQ [Steroidobacteraceae bacterium]|nr:3'(2'),5'-bisphosphate nucleotidase CysQ [Steroidobacteraceae bacterium]
MTDTERELLERTADIARRAGREILEVYGSGAVAASAKADQSPLTDADLRAHALIVRALAELTPDVPVLSEEAADAPYAVRRQWTRYWLVDPLDGTKEFLSRNGQFTVNIALIEGHAPKLGVVHVPVTDTSYRGLAGRGAWRQTAAAAAEPIRVARTAVAPLRVVGSRSHRGDSLDTFLERVGPHRLLALGSSLKFCIVAEGGADVYPRLGPTSEWDTAAAHAVLSAAGGTVSQLDGAPLQYNTRAEHLNPHFVAYGPRDRDWLALLR